MSAPLVSVVVPCFNAGPMLAPALESIVRQTHPALEIIFVDNGSTDASRATALGVLGAQEREYGIVDCPERGVNNARNAGYAHVRGDYVQWMDADDLMDADKIARQVAALAAAPDFDIAYGDWTMRWRPPHYPPAEQRRTLSQAKDQIHRTLCGVWYPLHLYLLRRAAADRLEAVEAWAPGRKVGTDVEYSAIAALIGMKFLHVGGAHVVYNIWSKGQISGTTPYAERALSLEAVFARLREFAASAPRGVSITARHRRLLDQDWAILSLPRDSASIVRLESRRARLSHLTSGRAIELRPREAAIAHAMLASGKALTSCHWGLLLTETKPPVAEDPLDVVETVQKLQKAGFLVATETAPEDAREAPQPSPGPRR